MNTPSRHSLLAAILAAGAVAAGGAVAASGQGRDPSTPTTFTVVTHRSAAGADHLTDVRPKGFSAGDQRQSTMPVFETNGARAGRVDLIAMAIPDQRELVLGSLVLGKGQLSFQVSTTKLETTYAITGGTGIYAGATGTVDVKPTSGGRTEVTVALA